jgi:DNA-binding NtrC family response regulator
VALRRELTATGIRVDETRSVAQCWELLAQAPASFLVVELTRASAEALLERLAWLERDYPLAQVAIVASRALANFQRAVREAGAIHFTTSPREAPALAGLAYRHLQAAPRPMRTLAEEIWAELPWGREEG